MKSHFLSDKELKAIRKIRNSLMHKARSPSVRELMVSLGYRSPRSAAVIIERLISKGILRRASDGNLRLLKNLEDDDVRTQTVDVPLVGNVACGTPILAEENIEAMIPVSTKLARESGRNTKIKINHHQPTMSRATFLKTLITKHFPRLNKKYSQNTPQKWAFLTLPLPKIDKSTKSYMLTVVSHHQNNRRPQLKVNK